MPRNQQGSIARGSSTPQLPVYPNWYVLPQRPITWIQCDHRVECEIDESTGIGRVRIKPGYSANVDEIRYGY